jgi:glycosyltransferase involved in cell wall biosynthesis
MTASWLPEQTHSEGDMTQLAKKPKLLFLAYTFPPLQRIGTVRTGNMARYLSRLGWEVTVVTPDPSLWQNVENCDKVSTELAREGIKRVLTGLRWKCLMASYVKCWNRNLGWLAGGVCRTIARRLGIDQYLGWIKAVEQACSTLGPKDVDVILASGGPFVAFRLARSLSDRLGRPYVLDYRDPWTGSPHAGRPPRPETVREEASLLQGCAAVTVVSPSWREELDRCYGVGEKVHVVTNGYDSSELASVKPHDFGHCAFVYTGIFYPPRRIISPFFSALKCLKESLNERSGEWYFHYYGGHEDHIREESVRFGLHDGIVLHGRVPRHEALSAVKGARLAVVVASIEEQASSEMLGMVPAKIYEAIGLGTPVLLIAPPGSDATTLLAPTGLVKSFTGAEIQGMASFLKDVVCGQVPQSKDSEICSWDNISKNLDALLRRCIISTTCRLNTRDKDRNRNSAIAARRVV